MHNKLTPFEVEKMRTTLAERSEFDELRKLYTTGYPQIADKNTGALWDRLNLQEKPLITENPMEEERLDLVAELIRGDQLRILNVGLGSANLEQKFFEGRPRQCVQWCGIDISSDSVKKAQREYPDANFSVGDILNMNFPEGSFDYVIALEVLEHIPPVHVLQALKEVSRVLKHGGYFIASVPLNEGLEEMLAKGQNPNAHVRVYTPALIEGELRISGFRVLNEKWLYAFHSLHSIKTFIARYSLVRKWHPNNIVVLAQKPDTLGCREEKYQTS